MQFTVMSLIDALFKNSLCPSLTHHVNNTTWQDLNLIIAAVIINTVLSSSWDNLFICTQNILSAKSYIDHDFESW